VADSRVVRVLMGLRSRVYCSEDSEEPWQASSKLAGTHFFLPVNSANPSRRISREFDATNSGAETLRPYLDIRIFGFAFKTRGSNLRAGLAFSGVLVTDQASKGVQHHKAFAVLPRSNPYCPLKKLRLFGCELDDLPPEIYGEEHGQNVLDEVRAQYGQRPDASPKTTKAEPPQVFVSYAWGDTSPNASEEDRQRQEVVERLCQTLEKENRKVSDKSTLRYGDLRSTLEKRISNSTRRMRRWHNEVGDLLAYLNDRLVPHGFDEIVKDDFEDLRQMLQRRR
jgi:hypothetical protein